VALGRTSGARLTPFTVRARLVLFQGHDRSPADGGRAVVSAGMQAVTGNKDVQARIDIPSSKPGKIPRHRDLTGGPQPKRQVESRSGKPVGLIRSQQVRGVVRVPNKLRLGHACKVWNSLETSCCPCSREAAPQVLQHSQCPPLSIIVTRKDVGNPQFTGSPSQVTDVYKGQVAIDADALTSQCMRPTV